MSWRIPGSVAVIDTEEAVYVANVPDGTPYVLDGSALLIWEALPGSVDEIVNSIGATGTTTDIEQLTRIVSGFLGELASLGLVEPAEPASPAGLSADG